MKRYNSRLSSSSRPSQTRLIYHKCRSLDIIPHEMWLIVQVNVPWSGFDALEEARGDGKGMSWRRGVVGLS